MVFNLEEELATNNLLQKLNSCLSGIEKETQDFIKETKSILDNIPTIQPKPNFKIIQGGKNKSAN